eukprot:3631374-Pleurochrysis_carterae.AAC.2
MQGTVRGFRSLDFVSSASVARISDIYEHSRSRRLYPSSQMPVRAPSSPRVCGATRFHLRAQSDDPIRHPWLNSDARC